MMASARSKYGNVRTQVEGKSFASKREAQRFTELRLLERAGQISDLKAQVRYPIAVNGKHVCFYVADFTYDERGAFVVEDAKGFRTDVFKLKASLMKAVHGLEIREV